MAERAPVRPAPVRQGAFARAVATVTQGLAWLLLALVLAILLEWGGMLLWWPEQGVAHSRALLAREVLYLDRDFRKSLLASNPARFARQAAGTTHQYLFEATGVTRLLDGLARPPGPDAGGARKRLHAVYRSVGDFVTAAIQVTQVFAVRLAILTLATPVFVLYTLVALVDGLVRRDLRRWGGGRESSFVYHYAKQSVLPLVALAWVVYLALPFSVHPSLIVLPFAALFALSVSIMAGTFKKYL
jgi:integrating conjugative element membrane protein (TIGR03747 family)